MIKVPGDPIWRDEEPVTKKVTKKTKELPSPISSPIPVTVRAAVERIERRGRPRSGKALSGAERMAAYKARRRRADIWADFAETVAADG